MAAKAAGFLSCERLFRRRRRLFLPNHPLRKFEKTAGVTTEAKYRFHTTYMMARPTRPLKLNPDAMELRNVRTVRRLRSYAASRFVLVTKPLLSS